MLVSAALTGWGTARPFGSVTAARAGERLANAASTADTKPTPARRERPFPHESPEKLISKAPKWRTDCRCHESSLAADSVSIRRISVDPRLKSSGSGLFPCADLALATRPCRPRGAKDPARYACPIDSAAAPEARSRGRCGSCSATVPRSRRTSAPARACAHPGAGRERRA